MVFDALKERGILLRNAPHLVKKQSFIIPCYTALEKIKYFIGLKVYDWLAGPLSFGSSKYISSKKLLELFPNLDSKNLKGGVTYFDGQFDDARLAVNLAQTAAEQGAVVLNYCKVVSLEKENGKIKAVTAIDEEEQKQYHLKAKAVINATGVFVDDVLKMDEENALPLVRPSQGVHIVVNKSFLAGSNSLLIPKTPDGRVLFAVPWHEHVLIGTTDTPLKQHSLEPRALEQEIDFILETIAQILKTPPAKKDILAVFAGLRPLAASQNNDEKTKEISRDHKIIVNASGLVTITGGKWTTYRKMAEDTLSKIMKRKMLPEKKCITRDLKIHGYALPQDAPDSLSFYGADKKELAQLMAINKSWAEPLAQDTDILIGQVIWAVKKEMARTVEDVLARRTRLLFIDARLANKLAPEVAEIMMKELGRDEVWKEKQIESFSKLAEGYVLKSNLNLTSGAFEENTTLEIKKGISN